MMKVDEFEFNLRELAGSMGDFGMLFPLAIGYIAICGFNPARLLVMMGLANIVTGFVYRLPMSIGRMKLLTVVAIAQHWSPSMVFASTFAKDIRLNKDLIPMGCTLLVSLATNMAYGFLAGLLIYHPIRLMFRKKGYWKCHTKEISYA